MFFGALDSIYFPPVLKNKQVFLEAFILIHELPFSPSIPFPVSTYNFSLSISFLSHRRKYIFFPQRRMNPRISIATMEDVFLSNTKSQAVIVVFVDVL